MKRQVFYSFHYEKDAMRASQIRQIGFFEGSKPVSDNEWEEVKRKGDSAIRKWIDDNMEYRSCVIVLIGEKTYERKWVRYEIEKAWKEGKGLFGIYIHNIRDPRTGRCNKGLNPFDYVIINGVPLSTKVKCYNPDPLAAYNDISNNIDKWVEIAINDRL